MTSDVKLTPQGVVVDGPLGVNEPNPQRPLHVTGDEIHSGGTGAGFSFASREAPFTSIPKKGERWVWYATGGQARLWSGTDKLSIDADGHVNAMVVSTIRPMSIQGVNFLGRPASVRLLAQDLSLSFMKINPETGTFSSAIIEDKSPVNNFALSHVEGDVLVINRGGGYTGGVRIEGAVTIGDHNVAAELATLRADLNALKQKVG